MFVKIVKNKAFFKRFQVQRRRRREGKTDYQARSRMVKQPKHKYESKKFRFVVRFTNTRVVCQMIYATISGDMCIAEATSNELSNYGVPAGLKNFAAAYCTGLLCARRALKTVNLDETFKGKEEVDGDEYHVEDEDTEKRPLKAILDVGLQRTISGCRIWGALKGATDGGLHIPHNTKRFPGYKAPEEKGGQGEYDADAVKEKIFGAHVKEYMEMLAEEDPTKYEAHFAKYIAHDKDADKLEEMYSECHSEIRKNPEKKNGTRKQQASKRKGNQITSPDGKQYTRCKKLSLQERKDRVKKKIEAAQAKMMEMDDE